MKIIELNSKEIKYLKKVIKTTGNFVFRGEKELGNNLINKLDKALTIPVVTKRTIPVTTIVENVLKQYRLDEVEKKGMQDAVANEILKDLYTSGYLK